MTINREIYEAIENSNYTPLFRTLVHYLDIDHFIDEEEDETNVFIILTLEKDGFSFNIKYSENYPPEAGDTTAIFNYKSSLLRYKYDNLGTNELEKNHPEIYDHDEDATFTGHVDSQCVVCVESSYRIKQELYEHLRNVIDLEMIAAEAEFLLTKMNFELDNYTVSIKSNQHIEYPTIDIYVNLGYSIPSYLSDLDIFIDLIHSTIADIHDKLPY